MHADTDAERCRIIDEEATWEEAQLLHQDI
jgi:hypothetical protein